MWHYAGEVFWNSKGLQCLHFHGATARTLKMKALQFVEMSETTQTTKEYHIPNCLNPQQHRCENLNSRKISPLLRRVTLCKSKLFVQLPTVLTLILLMWRKGWAPNDASKWQMGFNSAFKGLIDLKTMEYRVSFLLWNPEHPATRLFTVLWNPEHPATQLFTVLWHTGKHHEYLPQRTERFHLMTLPAAKVILH